MLTSSIVKKYGGFALTLALLSAGCGSQTGSANESASPKETKGSEAGGGGSNHGGVTLTNVFSQPKQLGVGDVLFADLNSSNSLDFDGVDPKAEFLFGMINASDSSGQFSVTMAGDLSSADLEIGKAEDIVEEQPQEAPALGMNDITDRFHTFLREQEKDLATLEIPEDSLSAGKSVDSSGSTSASVALGDSRTFKVLSNLASTKDYVEVTATVKCVASNVLFYVDTSVGSSLLSDADIQSLCSSFDPQVAREKELFGDFSDVDGNGKVIALFTPQVNRLGALGGGIVTGFFLASDLYPSSASNPASNDAEILYIMVPDPSGTYGSSVSRDFALSNLLPAVLPHELQHAINYNQHVFIAHGSSEVSCLNEGLSHLTEDLMGQGEENASRYGIYLKNPQSYPVVSCSQAGIGSRGGTYLFLRYLYEQSDNGNAFLRRLIQSNLTGIKNVEAAFAGRDLGFDQFGEFFLRWAVALSGITQDSRFAFHERAKDSATGRWDGACVVCNADDGRGTVLNGISSSAYRGSQNVATIPSAVRFFKMAGIKDKLEFRSPQGGEGYGVLIRTK